MHGYEMSVRWQMLSHQSVILCNSRLRLQIAVGSGAAVMQWLVRGGGRCAAWLSSVRSTTGEGDREAPPVGADADLDFTDFDHREFVSAGVAAGIAVRPVRRCASSSAALQLRTR